MKGVYKVRYYVEQWGKEPAEETTKTGVPGVRVAGPNFGYTDILFVASIIQDDDGNLASILLLDSDSKVLPGPSRKVLEAVRDQINHQLEHHPELHG